VTVALGGAPLEAKRQLGAGSVEIRIPLADLVGKNKTLTLRGPRDVAMGFRVHAAYKRPIAEQHEGEAAVEESWQSAKDGPDVYRIFTTPQGAPVDLAKVKAGELLRVAILVKLGDDEEQRSYLAIRDRIAAGFEPVDPDLDSVANAPAIEDGHPLASLLRYPSERASYVELHDDRVHIHFDRVYGETAVATYLLRATTPGSFVLPPATAELMYVPDSLSLSEGGRVTVL
jgi:hypothetical protein